MKVTKFQAEEIAGLLAVCVDDDEPVWGVLDGRELTVLRPVEAAEDLRWRARFLDSEGGSTAGARSLEKLAEQCGGV